MDMLRRSDLYCVFVLNEINSTMATCTSPYMSKASFTYTEHQQAAAAAAAAAVASSSNCCCCVWEQRFPAVEAQPLPLQSLDLMQHTNVYKGRRATTTTTTTTKTSSRKQRMRLQGLLLLLLLLLLEVTLTRVLLQQMLLLLLQCGVYMIYACCSNKGR